MSTNPAPAEPSMHYAAATTHCPECLKSKPAPELEPTEEDAEE